MDRKMRLRFWIEAIVAALTGSLGLLTLVWRDWIEGVFHQSPDAHNGSVEWLIVAVLLLLTGVLFALARSEWTRAAQTA